MNTKKGKNKQKHKPPTPQPPPEVSDVVKENPEKPADVQVKPELPKSEERVPEIVSEIVQPILEAKVSESDAPKKPKRNRGKKKKSDKGDEEYETEEGNLEDSKNIGEDQEKKDANVIEGKPAENPEVAPAARKKKNKNKKQSEPSEKQSEQGVKIAAAEKGDELTDLKIITVVPVPDAPEESKSKKKNKKKKRNDSERSDKAEEIISCTAAFQKLLEAKDAKDDKKDAKKDKPEEITSVKEIIPAKDADQSQLLKPEVAIRDKSTENKNKSKKKNKKDKKNTPKEESEDEGLKPLLTKTEIDSEGQTVTVPTNIEACSETAQQDEVKLSKPNIEKPQVQMPLIEKEKSPKPKAKIAKPVEKKRKDKQSASSNENLCENVPCEDKSKDIPNVQTENIKLEQKPIIAQPVEIIPTAEQKEEVKPTDVSVTKGEEPQVTQKPDAKLSEVKRDGASHLPEVNKIQLPESGTGKKRNKSPKPKGSKHVDTPIQTPPITPILEPNMTKLEEKEVSNLTQDTTAKKEETQATKVQSEPTPHLPEPKVIAPLETQPKSLNIELSTPQESTQTKILETPDVTKEPEIAGTVPEQTAVKEDIAATKQVGKDNIQVPEQSMGKKRKKSPKPQNKGGKVEVTESFISSTDVTKEIPPKGERETKTTEKAAATAAAEPVQEVPKEQSRPDSISDLPSLEDIEIRSVKADESEGSACDITPDIQYPRASSQHLDDNNNTVIRDVTSTDIKLNIPNVPSDSPLIQGSGETPLPTSLGSSLPGVTITELATSDPKQKNIATTSKSLEKDISSVKSEEKSDLKTKVLDVNQGMEELRRSIERSLAELSSMEKSEKEAEDQFFKAQAKLEQISQMASKKSEEKKQAPVTEIVKKTQGKTTETQKAPVEDIETKSKSKVSAKHVEEKKPVSKAEEIIAKPILPPPITEIKTEEPKASESITVLTPTVAQVPTEIQAPQTPPVPARKDNKGKNKKKKGKQDVENVSTSTAAGAPSASSGTTSTTSDTKESTQDSKKDEKSEQKTDNKSQEKGKQQSTSYEDETVNSTKDSILTDSMQMDFEPIENFEDALIAGDENELDVNKTFEMIADEANECDESQNPEINITAPTENEDETNDKKEQDKVNPVSQPKNLIGHPNIPARLNRTDYKKEKNKHQTPNTKQATVKIKDAVPIEITKECKESQTENKRRFLKDKTVTESITSMISENEEYIYKYSFRKVFLPSACHVCKKDLKLTRVPCNFCNLIFYCSVKHKDEDYQQHQGLCFAVSTIVHLRDQKHIYADAKNITGQEYRLLRMQMIVSCEKVLKRRLVPWEQEALLYPRMCADVSCREWRQSKLVDCEGCGQIAYCSADPSHLPKSHQRWCKSYSLYNKLVVYQQTKGRLEPTLPTRVMDELYQIPGKLNEVLASMYEEKIDMTDIQYAALTQIATAPLTAAYCCQLYNNKMNTIYANGALKKSSFTIHVVGAELQFEADALNKWEIFFLHLRPDVKDLRVVLVGPDLNPSKLPLDLLAKIKLCENCRQNKRRVLFEFQDKKTYHEYWSTDFTTPDLVCAFNPSIQRSSVFNGNDPWPATITCILKLKVPFIITSYTMSELQKDLARIKECSEVEVNTISEPEFNAFASVRPDRNFISDDEMPLLFKNFCFSTVCGAF